MVDKVAKVAAVFVIAVAVLAPASRPPAPPATPTMPPTQHEKDVAGIRAVLRQQYPGVPEADIEATARRAVAAWEQAR
jgi:hypothetical protein